MSIACPINKGSISKSIVSGLINDCESTPVEPPDTTTSNANFTPEQEGLADAGGGTDGGNGGSIQPAALEGNSIEYMGSDGADLFVIDFGSSFIADVITVTLAGIGILECVWNAVTSRFECVFAGIAAALVLSIGIEIEVTFVY